MRVALYARVSTDDKDQDPETQLRDLRSWAEAQGYEYDEFVDRASANDFRGRTAWAELMRRSLRSRPVYKIIAFAKWDRFARKVLLGFDDLSKLVRNGVEVVDLYTGIDTTTPFGQALAAQMMAIAESWLDDHKKSVRAGMARAKAQGKHVGRPRTRLTPQRAAAAVDEHGSVRAAATALGVSRSTVANRAAQFKNSELVWAAAKTRPEISPESHESEAG